MMVDIHRSIMHQLVRQGHYILDIESLNDLREFHASTIFVTLQRGVQNVAQFGCYEKNSTTIQLRITIAHNKSQTRLTQKILSILECASKI